MPRWRRCWLRRRIGTNYGFRRIFLTSKLWMGRRGFSTNSDGRVGATGLRGLGWHGLWLALVGQVGGTFRLCRGRIDLGTVNLRGGLLGIGRGGLPRPCFRWELGLGLVGPRLLWCRPLLASDLLCRVHSRELRCSSLLLHYFLLIRCELPVCRGSRCRRV